MMIIPRHDGDHDADALDDEGDSVCQEVLPEGRLRQLTCTAEMLQGGNALGVDMSAVSFGGGGVRESNKAEGRTPDLGERTETFSTSVYFTNCSLTSSLSQC